jgi:hypothetical protein
MAQGVVFKLKKRMPICPRRTRKNTKKVKIFSGYCKGDADLFVPVESASGSPPDKGELEGVSGLTVSFFVTSVKPETPPPPPLVRGGAKPHADSKSRMNQSFL